MVKNTTGGKGSKSLARKNEQGAASSSSGRLRLPASEFEVFALVTAALGNCMFHVSTETGIHKLILRLRGKFSGRNKRANFVAVGAFVLVGLHDYEAPRFKSADLLEIYSDADVGALASLPGLPRDFFMRKAAAAQSSAEDDVIFSSAAVAPLTNADFVSAVAADDEEIDIDDI
jgi:translation initiation factor IF-1